MYYFLLLLVAIAPSVAVVLYFYFKDKKKLAPKGNILNTFWLGLLITIPALCLEFLYSLAQNQLSGYSHFYLFFKAFFIVAFIEEFFKFLIVMFFVYNRVNFSGRMNGVIYTMIVSLGFACTENIIYVLSGGFGIAILRSFTALPMHAIAGGIMGYYIGAAKFSKTKQEETQQIYWGFASAILIHGIYDFVLLSLSQSKMVASILIWIFLVTVSSVLLNKIKTANQRDLAFEKLSG